MDLLDRLKVRLEITEDDENALLDELLISATEIFLSLKYPVSSCPVDDEEKPIIDSRWNGWIISAAVELYNKIGIEGQSGHTENGINRSYSADGLSNFLIRQVVPNVRIAGA